jgi:IclR family transcriptional regulator, pca regulon regulatory protein
VLSCFSLCETFSNIGIAIFQVEDRVSRASEQERDRETVAGLARGLKVLEAFNEGDGQMTLSEIARLTLMSPAAARRSLRTLASLGYVRNVGRYYILNARVLSLGAAFLRSADIESMLMPELRRIVGLFGDSAGVAALIDTNILYVAYHHMPRGMRPVAGTGIMYPAYPTSLGRMLLAHLDGPALDSYFAAARFEKFTKTTETSPARLRTILRQIRKQGYATIVDELFYGVTSVSVPILNAAGETIASLNSSAYTGHTTAEALVKTRLRELMKSSEQLTRIISSHPALQQALQTAPEQRQDIPQLRKPA